MVKDLIEILSWCRGANTKSEEEFVKLHIATIPGIERDGYGNYHLTIGEDPEVLWSCHTDTVTHKEGRQNVKWIGKGLLGLHNGKPGSCLGADDGAGIWLMWELIKNNKPGHYVFHREEEIGGCGSSWLSKNAARFPKSIQFAIAMDRAGTADIITHQGFQRCCSDAFAASLGRQLGAGWRGDDTGTFTDTANYTDLFAECTNLSVGYERNHGPMETLDVTHLRRLRDSLVELDISQLVSERQPGEVDWGGYGQSGMYHKDDWISQAYPTLTIERQIKTKPDMAQMVREHPGIAARLLEELGVEADEFRAHVFAFSGQLYDAS